MGALFLIFFLFLLSLIISSNSLLHNPENKVWGAKTFIHPEQIIPQTTDYKFITFIYNLYIYIVFDISYIRITLPGKYFKYFSLNFFILFILKAILYIFHPIVRWLFYIKYIFFNSKSYNFWEFIFINYENKEDKRYLLYLPESGWNHNPGPEFYQILTQLKLYNHSTNMHDMLLHNIANKIYFACQNIKTINTPYSLHYIKIPETRIAHPAIVNNYEFNTNASHLIFTDFKKAILNGVYDKTIILPKITTIKEAIILGHNGTVVESLPTTHFVTPSYLAQNLLDHKQDPQVIQIIKEYSYSPLILPPRVNTIHDIKAALASDIHNSMLNEGYDHEHATQFLQNIFYYLEKNNHTFFN